MDELNGIQERICDLEDKDEEIIQDATQRDGDGKDEWVRKSTEGRTSWSNTHLTWVLDRKNRENEGKFQQGNGWELSATERKEVQENPKQGK